MAFGGKKVLVTGGTGFIGSNLVSFLLSSSARVRVVSRGKLRRITQATNRDAEYLITDLTRIDDCREAVKNMDYVFHLAASGGGLVFNMQHPAQIFTPNILMNTNMLEASRQEGVEKYLFCSSSSVYPPNLEVLEEDKAWQDNPHESDAFFSWSKKMGELQAAAYKKEYEMNIAIARLGNPYGPGDNFDPETSHVIPALISRAANGENPFVVWGAGEATRSFVHVRDVVEALTIILDRYTICDPVNVASGESVKIKDVVKMVLEIFNYGGKLEFDTTKKEGHLLKVMSIDKLTSKVGYVPKIRLKEGLQETVDWYLKQRKASAKI